MVSVYCLVGAFLELEMALPFNWEAAQCHVAVGAFFVDMHKIARLIIREMLFDETGDIISPGKIDLLEADDISVSGLDEPHDRVHAGDSTPRGFELRLSPHDEAADIVRYNFNGLAAFLRT